MVFSTNSVRRDSAVYIILVLAQTVVLPLVSGTIELLVGGGDPVLVYGRWFLFWGVGTRLLVAGVSQIFRPGFTVQNILGEPNAGATQIAQELGFANLSIGVGAIVAAFVPGWAVPVAIIGGLFLGLAGFRHVAKKHPNVKEIVATWTDILLFLAMAAYVLVSLVVGR
jgi:hypothetical protein